MPLQRLISLSSGVPLIAASLFKARQWMSDPFAESDVPPILGLRVAVMEYELALGFWLISGFRARTAWTAAIATFTLFLTFTVRDALIGRESCACFGDVPTHPWLMAALDLIAIVCLVGFFPRQLPVHRLVSILATCLLLLIGTATTALVLSAHPHRLLVSPDTFDVSSTAPGSSSTATFILENAGDRPIDITTIETSCHCLTVYLPKRTVTPGEQALGEIVFASPRGIAAQNLKMSVHGYDPSGRVLFNLTITASYP